RYVSSDASRPVSRHSFDEAKAPVRTLHVEAERRRVDTDLPICVMFRGGIDSALVLQHAHRDHPDVTALSFGLPGSNDREIA
ncbi:asparagine synthase-related protein, partial [Burkholderia pseudomallei]